MHGRLLAYILAAVLAPALALAAPITSLVVVGDSLSDDGNGFILTGGTFPPPPYDQGGSNGPVAVEYLASALGLPLAPSAAGGTNYAVLGAATGAVEIPLLSALDDGKCGGAPVRSAGTRRHQSSDPDFGRF